MARGLGTPAMCCLSLPAALRVLQKCGEHGVSPFGVPPRVICCCLSIGRSRPSGYLKREEQVGLAGSAAGGRGRGRARGGCESGRRLCGPRRASRARSDRQSLVYSELEEARIRRRAADPAVDDTDHVPGPLAEHLHRPGRASGRHRRQQQQGLSAVLRPRLYVEVPR